MINLISGFAVIAAAFFLSYLLMMEFRHRRWVKHTDSALALIADKGCPRCHHEHLGPEDCNDWEP